MEDISDDDDEQLKLAIALSLQEAGLAPEHEPRLSTRTTETIDLTEEDNDVSTAPSKESVRPMTPKDTGLGLMGLDRKAMEAERLARKRKASVSPPPLRSKSLKTSHGTLESNDVVKANASMSSHLPAQEVKASKVPDPSLAGAKVPDQTAIQFPEGVVRKTWALGFPRQDDIKLEEVLRRRDLKVAVLSSFQWEVDWLLSKIDTSDTKIVMVMQAKDEATKQQYRRETASMPNLRLCFPSMEGQVNCMHSKLMLLAHPSYLRVAVPTANLVPYDWGESGVMENTVFLIDLPRHPKGHKAPAEDLTFFCKELIYFCEAMGLQPEIVNSLYDFDFSATKDIAFVHTIGGAHTGEAWRRTGYCGLGRAVRQLGLATEQQLQVDFITSSIGAINIDFLNMLYLAAQGDDGLREYGWRTHRGTDTGKGKKKSANADATVQQQLVKNIEQNFRLYFPSRTTVLASRGGVDCGGPICFSSRWYNAPSFPQQILRDCKSTRQGLLMHNKVSPAQDLRWVKLLMRA